MPGRRCGGHARCNPVTRYCDQRRAGTLATPSQLIPSNTPHKRHSLHTCKEPPRRPRTSSSAHPRRQRYQRPRGASTTTAPQAMATATPPAPALREHLAGGRSVIPASTTDVLARQRTNHSPRFWKWFTVRCKVWCARPYTPMPWSPMLYADCCGPMCAVVCDGYGAYCWEHWCRQVGHRRRSALRSVSSY